MNIFRLSQLEGLQEAADKSPRKRAPYLIHNPQDYLQRMVQVANRGTYTRPHIHENKLEIFVILKGSLAVNTFTYEGDLKETVLLGEDAVYAEIPPMTYHNILVPKNAAFVEIIKGYYDPLTHKDFAPWAPAEGTPEAIEYVKALEKRIKELL